jgi:hypothetical protein
MLGELLEQWNLAAPASAADSAVRVGRLRYCGLARMLLHNVETTRLLNDGLHVLKDVPRDNREGGWVTSELHVLLVCEGHLLNAVEVAAFAEEVCHARF